MPLTSRSNTEPKNKRAKTERNKLSKNKSSASTASSSTSLVSNGTDNANNLNTSNTASSIENEEPNVTVPTVTTNAKNDKSNKIIEQAIKNIDEEMETSSPTVEIKTATVLAESVTTTTNGTHKIVNKILNSTVNTTLNTTSASANFEETIMTETSHINSNPLPELSINRNTSKPGYVLSVGENLSNQLGFGLEVDNRKKPQLIKSLPSNVIQVAAGGMHSACLTEDGIVYTFGCNDEYALGRDNDEDIDKVELPEKSIEITAGDSHTAALSESGVVYAWGTFRDGSGVLGLEQKKIAKTPMKFKLREKIIKISSGADHLVFLASNGEVYTAGNSEHGQLGRVSKYNSCRGGRRGCDMILVPGQVRLGKRKELQKHKEIEDIWTTSYCSFLKLKDSDLIIGFGLNNCYQLGIEDGENRYQPEILSTLKFEAKLKKVIGGMHHTLFLDVKGNVYAMGSHRYGGLGLGKIDADLKAPAKIPDLKDIVDIAANTNVSYAIDKNGKVFNWGSNYSKQLGQDTEDDYYVPTLVQSRNLDSREVYSVSVGGQHSLFTVSEEIEKDSD
jgi:regulator of chromosome condensation